MPKKLPKVSIREIAFFEKMYQADICYLIGGGVSDLIHFINKRHRNYTMYSWDKKFEWGEDSDTTDGYQFHITAPLGRGEKFYVWVHEPTPYLISHETYHLTGDILFTRGIEYGYGSEEAYAYLHGSIFQEIAKQLGWA